MNVFVLTGAGISAESGLPTFRDPDGLWERYSPYDLATPEAFARDPALVRRFYDARRRALAGVAPNSAHLALARLGRELATRGDGLFLCTQNVDDLHERGGAANVHHMHGELRKARCTACGAVEPFDRDMDRNADCPSCGEAETLRPHVVWFGEMPFGLEAIGHALDEADVFAAIGTSGTVHPAGEWRMRIDHEISDLENFGPPLLLNVTNEFIGAKKKIILFGQETNGWGWDSDLNRRFTKYPPWSFGDMHSLRDFAVHDDSVDALCWAYREFDFGKKQGLGGTPFWQAFNEVAAWQEAAVLWSNLGRSDYFTESPGFSSRSFRYAPETLKKIYMQWQRSVHIGELHALLPDACLFFSGPNYDFLIEDIFPGVTFTEIGGISKRALARLSHSDLPVDSFRTYHPNYLGQGNCWHFIGLIHAEIYK